jgi:hypothetical protein
MKISQQLKEIAAKEESEAMPYQNVIHVGKRLYMSYHC